MGATSGVHIVDNTDPASPQYVGDFTHGRALDPVVAQNGYAYVNPASPEFEQAVPGVDCADVIAQGQQLFVIDDLGLSQYSTASGVPILLSTIDTEPVVYVTGQ